MKYIDVDKLIKSVNNYQEGAKAALNPLDGDADYYKGKIDTCENIKEFIYSLQQEQPEVNLMDTRIQYASVYGGIKSFAETYSFNIDSRLFPQLSKEQQELWRKEIEQAAVSGGDMGITLARDVRYKENQSQPEVDLDGALTSFMCRYAYENGGKYPLTIDIAYYFYELGLNARKEVEL